MTIREWLLREFADEPDTICEMARVGVEAGFGGLTTYADCSAMYTECERDIWDVLNETAGDLGRKSGLHLVAESQGDSPVWSDKHFRQLAVHAAVSRVALLLADEQPWSTGGGEDDEDDEEDADA